MTEQDTLRILVIDDNPDIHKDFQTILESGQDEELDVLERDFFGEPETPEAERLRYTLSFASQGVDGYNEVRQSLSTHAPYQLAFVDMRMPPGWDGLETVEQIWRVDPRVQVVVCTAYSDYTLAEITRRLGQTDNLLILKKPFDSIEVRQLASALTCKWRLARQADLTVRQLEEMVGQRTGELEEARARAEAANEAKGIFLANMSHDLRTPLNGIVGMIDLLLDSELTAEQQDYAETVHSCCYSLLNLINDILDYSKIEAGRLELDHQDFELREQLNDVIVPFALQAQSKGLELLCAVESGLPGRLRGDPWRLRNAGEAGNGEYAPVRPAAESRKRHSIHKLKVRKEVAGSRVLVVEDNAINSRLVTIILEKLGIQPITACNGREAVQFLEKETADLVLMDIQMPVMNGYEATRRIREMERTAPGASAASRMPILAMTANVMGDERERTEETGMDDYISKPVDPDLLVERLVAWLGPKDRAGKPAPSVVPEGDARTENGAASEQPAFNLDRLLDWTSGDLALARSLLQDFMAAISAQLPALRETLASGDMEQLGIMTHGIKGAAGNLGDAALHAAAQAMETAVLAKNEEVVSQKFELLVQQFDDLRQRVKELFE